MMSCPVDSADRWYSLYYDEEWRSELALSGNTLSYEDSELRSLVFWGTDRGCSRFPHGGQNENKTLC